jgi:hypothetical protein
MASLERRVAIDAARAAGQLLRDARAGSRHITYKGAPTNLVTEMDARAEALVLDTCSAPSPTPSWPRRAARWLGASLDHRSLDGTTSTRGVHLGGVDRWSRRARPWASCSSLPRQAVRGGVRERHGQGAPRGVHAQSR